MQAVWEFEVDVADFNLKFVDFIIDSMQRELMDLLKKKELSAEDLFIRLLISSSSR